jgi:hypothetical protein
MRRSLLIALFGISVMVLPSTAVAKSKPPSFKLGTYKAKAGFATFNITLKRGTCAVAAGQSKSSLKLCTAVPVSPIIVCPIPIVIENPIGNFAAAVQLPTSGKLSRKAPIAPLASFPGAAPTTGESTFSVTFTKKGTASGSIAESLIENFGTSTQPCTVTTPFTAKLG